MPLMSEPYWFVKCDGCGEDIDYGDHSAWKDVGVAADQALDIEWTSRDGLWHCPNCPSLGDEDDDGE